jgi:nitrogen regulatory protein PII
MNDMKLHPMKEVKIIIEGEHIHFVTDVLDQIKASGYTIFSNISGKGQNGYHEGHLMFNDTSSLQMVLTVVSNPFWSAIQEVFLCWTRAYSGPIILIQKTPKRAY